MVQYVKKLAIAIMALGGIIMVQSCNEETFDTTLLKDTANPVVSIQTTVGDIYVELYEKEAPLTVTNFLSYAKDGFYNGTIFHRVIDGFMIQGGGFEPGLKEKQSKDPIKNEAVNGLKNEKGTLAMARTQVVDSATNQFFINLNTNAFLDHQGTSPQQYGYAVFGRVIEGMDHVEAIGKVKTGTVSYYEDVPLSDIVIDNVLIIQ